MAITFVNAATGAGTTATSRATSLPSGVVTGDPLELYVVLDGDRTASLVTPRDWTLRWARVGTDLVTLACLTRLHDGSAAPTLTWGGASIYNGYVMLGYTGAATIDAAGVAVQNAADRLPTSPSVTTSQDDDMLTWATFCTSGTPIRPTGFTDRAGSGLNLGLLIADKLAGTAGPTGTFPGSNGTASRSITGLVAIAPPVVPVSRRPRLNLLGVG